MIGVTLSKAEEEVLVTRPKASGNGFRLDVDGFGIDVVLGLKLMWLGISPHQLYTRKHIKSKPNHINSQPETTSILNPLTTSILNPTGCGTYRGAPSLLLSWYGLGRAPPSQLDLSGKRFNLSGNGVYYTA